MPSGLRTSGAWPRAAAVLAGAALAAVLAACSASTPAGSAHADGPSAHRSAASGRSATGPAQASPQPSAQGTPGVARTAGPAGDTRSRFWYGTDSFTMAVTGGGPFIQPVIGGVYGGYTGMAGNWAHWQGCGGQLVWSAANARQAAVNHSTYHKGVGTGAYWFMAGPGVDPHYDGSVSEARTWGQRQAARAVADVGRMVNYPVLWMDVELPGNAPTFTPAKDNGWQAVYTTPCSGHVKTRHIDPAVDRGVVDGFAAYLTAHSSYKPGVYSAPPAWKSIFGTGRAARIPGLYEWTYTQNTSSLAHRPSAWCLKGTSTCAHFFGGQHASGATALMWQWSGGGGTRNGFGDFDQINGARTP